MFKYKIILYKIEKNNNKNSANLLNFAIFEEIQSESGEKIINERLFTYKNLISYQTDTKIIFYAFKTNKNINSQIIIYDKKQNFQRQIPNSDELNILRN